MVEDGEEHNLVTTCNNSKEPEEESFKQGTGDLRACGPSTFFNVDSFIKIGETKPLPLSGLACAAVNTVNTIDQNETELKENVHGNVNENVQIDLSNKKIESSTDIDSVVAEIDSVMANIDPVVVAELVNAAEPADTGGTVTNIDSQEQSITINLCQTISCDSTTLNICFDSGAQVTLVSKKVAEMSIDRENVRYDLDTIGGRSSLRGSGAVRIPLALKGGGIHALKAFVTNKPIGEVAVLPPDADVAQTFDAPEGSFAARNGGVIDIIMGMDNAHFFPWNLGPSRKTDCGLVLFRAVLGKGLLYAGPTRGILKKVTALPPPLKDGPP
jgi:hypothetical protein